MELIVLAGGLGTRLKSIVSGIPKVMADINGKPFLEYLLQYVSAQDIRKVVLSVGYKHEMILNHFKERFNNIILEYAIEKEPLGTGGGIRQAIESIEGDDVYIINADTFFKIDFKTVHDFHKTKKADLTMVLKPMVKFNRYGHVVIDEDNRIISFEEKQYKDFGLINGGCYLLNREYFKTLTLPVSFSFENAFLKKYVHESKFYGIPLDNYFIDIGIPDDYKKANKDFKKYPDLE